MNCIEVSGKEKIKDEEMRKIAALSSFYNISIQKASETAVLSESSVYTLSTTISSLVDGVFLSRMVKRADNEKMEECGHSTVLVKKPKSWYYYDPNTGLSIENPIVKSLMLLLLLLLKTQASIGKQIIKPFIN